VTKINLFNLNTGSVVAPAGCGKTQTIIDALSGYEGPPVLVLTHTNAGVTALRNRLTKAGVRPSANRIATIDGWSLHLITRYPGLGGHRNAVDNINYQATQEAAIAIVESGAIDAVLRATYGRMVVDEYQDCSARQHRLVQALAARLPCHVLGDPLQCIFNFNGAHAHWQNDVINVFPVVAELNDPHRWINAGETDFGAWVLQCRAPLLTAGRIDLTMAPPNVRWIRKRNTPAEREAAQAEAVASKRVNDRQTLLIIGNPRNPDSRVHFARANEGVQVVEPVEMRDLISSAIEITEAAIGLERLTATLKFAASTTTNVNTLVQRLNVLRRGSDANDEDEVEGACLRLWDGGDLQDVHALLTGIGRGKDRWVYRPHLLAVMNAALNRAISRGLNLHDAALAEREAQRMKGRLLPSRGVGSTLLLKGLESDHAIILDADTMNANNFYVAITRASRTLTIFSTNPILEF
jgi:DNA helicase-2/ATP-dependent DNA helicase PcrA